MLIFDYIYDKILLNQNIKNNTFKAFFISAILSNNIVLDYYLDKHTNNLVNLQIKEQELDLSKLNELSSSINTKKNLGLISLLKNDPYNIIIMNGLLLDLFNYEMNILNPKKWILSKGKQVITLSLKIFIQINYLKK